MAKITKIPPALWVVFGWLFWGDFVLVLMEQLVPNVIPVMLKNNQMSNTAISLIMGTIPGFIGLFIMPVIAYRSDQTRTRWGRRIPFLAASIPVICLSLLMLPYAPSIGLLVNQNAWLDSFFKSVGIAPVTLIMGAILVVYALFNSICSSCYSFLVVDVVDGKFMGRFMSFFRIFGLAAVFIFSYFCMGLADTNPHVLFFGAALLYGIGFLIVCLRVKEPAQSPRVATNDRTGLFAILKSYRHECFRHPLYLWLYAAFAVYGISQLAGNLFDILFMKETLNMSMDTLGKIRAWTTIAVIPLAYFGGNFIDRWKSQRVIVLFAFILAGIKLIGFFLVCDAVSYIVVTIIYNISAFFWGVAISSYLPNIMPKDRFGQFACCNGFITGSILIVSNPVCGIFFDYVKNYQYVYLWPAILMVVAGLLLLKVNRYWEKCGGENYIAP
jgi:MFS family permease